MVSAGSSPIRKAPLTCFTWIELNHSGPLWISPTWVKYVRGAFLMGGEPAEAILWSFVLWFTILECVLGNICGFNFKLLLGQHFTNIKGSVDPKLVFQCLVDAGELNPLHSLLSSYWIVQISSLHLPKSALPIMRGSQHPYWMGGVGTHINGQEHPKQIGIVISETHPETFFTDESGGTCKRCTPHWFSYWQSWGFWSPMTISTTSHIHGRET